MLYSILSKSCSFFPFCFFLFTGNFLGRFKRYVAGVLYWENTKVFKGRKRWRNKLSSLCVAGVNPDSQGGFVSVILTLAFILQLLLQWMKMKAVQFTFLLLVSYCFESSKYHNFIFLVVLVFLYCFFFLGGGGGY